MTRRDFAVHLGLNLNVATSGIGPEWYAVPVLVLSALRAAVQEEVIVVAFLFARLDDLRWPTWAIIATSAVLRGSYHLYQGFGGFIGNAIMGGVFGLVYRRFGRVAPGRLRLSCALAVGGLGPAARAFRRILRRRLLAFGRGRRRRAFGPGCQFLRHRGRRNDVDGDGFRRNRQKLLWACEQHKTPEQQCHVPDGGKGEARAHEKPCSAARAPSRPAVPECQGLVSRTSGRSERRSGIRDPGATARNVGILARR